MRKILILILLTFTMIIFASEQDIYIPFTEESAKHWQYISDKTMGGVSDGKAIIEQDGEIFFARLTGNVSTKNNGGFIQLRSRLSFVDLERNQKTPKGIRINVRGNGEVYHIFIQTNQAKSYRDYYSISFDANPDWQLVDLPFNKFKHKLSNDLNLESKNIRTLGIVAYGRDFISDVSVSDITFYY